MDKIKKNMNLILSAASAVNVVFMITYMIVSVETIYIKSMMMFQFALDFYFLTRNIYLHQSYKKKYERVIFLVINVSIFLMSTFNLFFVFNIFSLNRSFLFVPFIAGLLTRYYHIIFCIYIVRIVLFFYNFALEDKKKLSSLITSRLVVTLSLSFAIIFIVLYSVSNALFFDKLISRYNSTKSTILYEATNLFRQSEDIDGIDYMAFARDYGFQVFYYDMDLKYKSENFQEFENRFLLFETSIIQGEGFFFMRSGKIFTLPLYVALLLYSIIFSISITISIFFLKFYMYKKYEVYTNIIISALEEDSYNQAIKIEGMEDIEVKRLSESYNEKILAFKYRERYIKNLLK